MSTRWIKKCSLGLAVGLAVTMGAMAQASSNAATPFATGSEFLIGGGGFFTRSTPVNSLTYSANSTGVLDLGYRYQWTDRSAVLVRYTFSDYLHNEGTPAQLANDPYQNHLQVQAYVNELSIEYNYSWTFGKVRPFVLGGIGAVMLDPTGASTNTAYASAETKPEALYGGGVDFALNHKVSIRGEFRGQVYTTPLFRYPNAGIPSWTQTYAPDVAVLWHFGG